MRIVLIGSSGLLGQAIQMQAAHLHNHELIPLTHQQLDITNLERINRVLRNLNPDVVINSASYTKVDLCENDPKTCYDVNELGAEMVAQVCAHLKIDLMYISTDYVFDGLKKAPYCELDHPNPLQCYGKAKLGGEIEVKSHCEKYYIIRTSWLYGPCRDNFVKKILTRAKNETTIQVVDDQIGSPTNVQDLAEAIFELIFNNQYGLYHLSGCGPCSWYDFAKQVVLLSSLSTNVIPCKTGEYPTVAIRPAYSYLDNSQYRRIFNKDLSHWQDSLKKMIKQNLC